MRILSCLRRRVDESGGKRTLPVAAAVHTPCFNVRQAFLAAVWASVWVGQETSSALLPVFTCTVEVLHYGFVACGRACIVLPPFEAFCGRYSSCAVDAVGAKR